VSHLSSQPQLWTWPYDVLNLRASDPQVPKAIREIVVLEQAPFLMPAHHGEHHLIDPNAPQRALDDLMQEGQTKMASGEGKLPDNETKEEREYRRAIKHNRPLDTNFPLAAGRVLQFRHEYGGEYGAKHYYIECRPGDDQMQDYVNELVNDFREPNQKPPVLRYALALRSRKQDATYWLGLISFDEHEYSTAEEYFKNLLLDVWPPAEDFWTDGAHYNLARTYEASGRTDEAVKLYEADDSAQRHGNHLRARWLKETSAEKKSTETAPAEKPAEKKSADAADAPSTEKGAKKD
jgi:tetratricopeptide (TPR) repeat protein